VQFAVIMKMSINSKVAPSTFNLW